MNKLLIAGLLLCSAAYPLIAMESQQCHVKEHDKRRPTIGIRSLPGRVAQRTPQIATTRDEFESSTTEVRRVTPFATARLPVPPSSPILRGEERTPSLPTTLPIPMGSIPSDTLDRQDMELLTLFNVDEVEDLPSLAIADVNPYRIISREEEPLPAIIVVPAQTITSIPSVQKSKLAKDIEALNIRDRHHCDFNEWENLARKLQAMQRVSFKGLEDRLSKEISNAPEDEKHMYKMLKHASTNIEFRERWAKKREAAIKKDVDEMLPGFEKKEEKEGMEGFDLLTAAAREMEIKKRIKPYKLMSNAERKEYVKRHFTSLQIPDGEHSRDKWEVWAKQLQVKQEVGFVAVANRLASLKGTFSENEQHKCDMLIKACDRLDSRIVREKKRQRSHDEEQSQAKRKRTE